MKSLTCELLIVMRISEKITLHPVFALRETGCGDAHACDNTALFRVSGSAVGFLGTMA